MSFPALWFPSIGTFAIVLAVGGTIVSLLSFTGWKKVVLVLLSAFLGIGELVSIHMADEAHNLEIRSQHRDAEKLEEELRASETERRVDAAILQTKLKDYSELFRLVPAIMKMAKTGAELEKRMVETKSSRDQDAYERAIGLVKKIQESAAKHDQIEEQQLQQARRLAHGRKTDAELMVDDMTRSFVLSQQRTADFQRLMSPEAVFVVNDLKRRLPPPTLDATDQAIVNAALTMGSLAGPHPESKVAAYLELWAKPLAQETRNKDSGSEGKLSHP